MTDVSTGARPENVSPARRLTHLRGFQLLAIVLICLAVVAAARVGVQRNLHDSLSNSSWGRAQFAIGAALSSRYHGAYGYTSFIVTRTVLAYAGLSNDPAALTALGTRFPENLRDGALIKAAIAKAAEFKTSYDPDVGIVGSSGEDVGLVDYVRLAFALFGNKLASFFWTYFTLVSISLLAAVIAFRKMPGLLTVFILYALALAILFASDVFDFSDVGILDPRFLSTLSVIPATHLALIMLVRQQPSVGQVALVILQSAILIFGYWIRISALWTILALALLAAALVCHALWRHRTASLQRIWPFAILAGLVTAHVVYVAQVLHPVYQQGDERPHHGLWHAFIYSLAHHPDWDGKYAHKFGPEGDPMPDNVAKKYLLTHPPVDPKAVYLTEDREYLRIGATEPYKRKAFLDFFANDPKFVLEAFLIYNVKISRDAFMSYLSSLDGVSVTGWTLLAMALLLQLQHSWRGIAVSDRAHFGRVLIVSAGLVLSTVPIVLTAPSHPVMTDQFLMLTASAIGWIVVAMSYAIALARPDEQVAL